jgi:hypothetical protein
MALLCTSPSPSPPTGDVTSVQATGDSHRMILWPQLQGEVYQWKFIPFEKTASPQPSKSRRTSVLSVCRLKAVIGKEDF